LTEFWAPLRKISAIFSTSKIHLLELLPVTFSLMVLTHLIFSRICIGSQLINALNSNLPHWRTTFSTPLSLLIYVLCSIITLPHVLCILPTPIFCQFYVSAQPLPPVVLALQPPQSGTHYPLASAVLPLQTLSIASLKLAASRGPTAPPSSSAKCLRFGHWLTLCTLNIHILTYLLTYKLVSFNWILHFCKVCKLDYITRSVHVAVAIAATSKFTLDAKLVKWEILNVSCSQQIFLFRFKLGLLKTKNSVKLT